ncbi:MAG: diguanylate cyclase [Gammaproteobacteria bacterium]|nr:diguanylate cyclase [Gammaproteobacteria bacterium]
MVAWREAWSKPWIQALVLGSVGALLNEVSRPPIFSVALYLAGIGYFYILFRFGWRPALVAAAMAALPLLGTTAVYRPLLEVLVFALLLGRLRLSLWGSVLIYWLVVAWPIALWVTSAFTEVPLAVYWPGMLAMGGNAALNLLLARQWVLYSSEVQSREGISFQHQLSHWLIVFGLAPLLVLSIMVNHGYLHNHLAEIAKDVDHEREEAAARIQLHLDRQFQALRIVANQMLVEGRPDYLRAQGLVAALRANSTAIMSLWVLDQDGVVRSAVSQEPAPEDPAIGSNAADRAYFQESRRTLKPYVSDVFLGRGYATRKLVVALSVPVVYEGRFLGVVEASLDLDAFPQRVGRDVDHGALRALILDSRQHVVQADAVLGLAYDSEAPETLRRLLSRPLPSHEVLLKDLRRQQYRLHLVRWRELASPRWTVLMLYDLKPEIFLFNMRSLLTCVMALALLGLIGRLAQRRAARMLEPLVLLNRRAESLDMSSLPRQVPLSAEQGARELMSLLRAFNAMVARMAKSHLQLLDSMDERERLNQALEASNRELESKVVERTEELSHKASMLEELAITDELTGLRNRRYLSHELGKEWRRAKRFGSAFSLLLMDIDHFKLINDAHGHAAGDAVLVAVARILREAARETDCVARWGGEEFVILLPGVSGAGTRAFAERLRLQIAELTVPVREQRLSCTVSIGLADSLDLVADTPERLLELADKALYRAKSEGRNRVCA